MLGFFGWYADAAVFYSKLDLRVVQGHSEGGAFFLTLTIGLEAFGLLGEGHRIVEQEGQGADGSLFVGGEDGGLSTGIHLQVEVEMGSLPDAGVFHCLVGDTDNRHHVGTFNHRTAIDIRQLQHLVDEARDTIGVLRNPVVDVLLGSDIEFHAWRGENLREAAEDVQWGADLMADLADEVGLHLRAFLGACRGDEQLLIFLLQPDGSPMTEEDEEQEGHDDDEGNDEHEGELKPFMLLLLPLLLGGELVELEPLVEFIQLMAVVGHGSRVGQVLPQLHVFQGFLIAAKSFVRLIEILIGILERAVGELILIAGV